MDVRDVRGALKEIGVDVNLTKVCSPAQSTTHCMHPRKHGVTLECLVQAYSMMQQHSKDGMVNASMAQDDFISLLSIEFNAATQPRKLPRKPSAAASTAFLKIDGQNTTDVTEADVLDPMGVPAKTAEGLRRQLLEMERAQGELQRQSQITISRNGQQLVVLQARLEGLHNDLASQQKQSHSRPLVPTVDEEQQMRLADEEVSARTRK